MKFRNTIKRTNAITKSTFKVGIVVMLLSFYLVGVLQVESLHYLIHAHDNVALHSAEQEKDLCHREVYHHEQKDGCHHKVHVKQLKTCSLCQVCTHATHLLSSIDNTEYITYITRFRQYEMVRVVQQRFTYLPSRAPPTA